VHVKGVCEGSEIKGLLQEIPSEVQEKKRCFICLFCSIVFNVCFVGCILCL